MSETLPVKLQERLWSTSPLRFTSPKIQEAVDAAVAAAPPDHSRLLLRVDLDGAYLVGVKRLGAGLSLRAIGGLDWESRKLEGAVELVGSWED
ncbi:hypothetical protein [Longimicrobium sp.]|uniref:hypothetical protein n=1 Tax=Longimicrobium sp. TaxID=2029185 RepID=UPI002E33F3A3|nr:hypothetical protein [Longimicrobium sp.]HEX6038899.1 hypothetical protein [Longimicrobium sp.]